MKIGCCFDIKKDLSMLPREADYIEIAGWTLNTLDNDAYSALLREARAGRFCAYSSNGLIDPAFRLTGPDVDTASIRAYCDRLFYRLAELGVSILVFGSGKAKHVPEGFPMEQAWDQLVELGRLMADIAAPLGQTVVAEPLSYNEVNILNTVEEAADYVRRIDRSNFKLLVDFYHFNNNREDFSTLTANASLLAHTHISSPLARSVPRSEEDWAFYRRCMSLLHSMGYRGGISFEGGSATAEEKEQMLARMKEILREIEA